MAEPARRSNCTFKNWIELPEPRGDLSEFPQLSDCGAPLPRQRATQDTKHGHGFWNWVAGPHVEGVTLSWLMAVLALNPRDKLLVNINRQGHDEYPIMLAARNRKAELVRLGDPAHAAKPHRGAGELHDRPLQGRPASPPQRLHKPA